VSLPFQQGFLAQSLNVIFNLLAPYSPTTKYLLKGKAPYGLPPCTNYFRSAPFYIEHIIYLFTKQATLMRRSTVLSLPSQLGFPA